MICTQTFRDFNHASFWLRKFSLKIGQISKIILSLIKVGSLFIVCSNSVRWYLEKKVPTREMERRRCFWLATPLHAKMVIYNFCQNNFFWESRERQQPEVHVKGVSVKTDLLPKLNLHTRRTSSLCHQISALTATCLLTTIFLPRKYANSA